MKHVHTQMQHRFTVIYETPSSISRLNDKKIYKTPYYLKFVYFSAAIVILLTGPVLTASPKAGIIISNIHF